MSTDADDVAEMDDDSTAVEPSDPRPAVLSLTDAATACDVARRTLTRALDAGKFPGAWRADGRQGPGSGPWMVPVVELMAAGYMPKVSEPTRAPLGAPRISSTTSSVDASAQADALTEELQALKSRLSAAEHRAEMAEALATERERALDDLRTALRVLEASRPAPATPAPTVDLDPDHVHLAAPETREISMHPLRVEIPRGRRRWWRRNDAR